MIGNNNFNTDVALWQSSRDAHRATRTIFEVSKYGSVWKRGGAPERVAQFDDYIDAVHVLLEAGYKQNGNTFR